MLNAFKKKEGNKKEIVSEKNEAAPAPKTAGRKEKPSIYKIILGNVKENGTLNVQRIEEELWKMENKPEEVIFMAGYRDNLKSEPREVNEITGMLIIEKLGKGNYKKTGEFEADFLKLDTGAKEFLNFFHSNAVKAKPDLKMVHDFMAEVLMNTTNMEVFKIAFEIVGNFSDSSTEDVIFTIGQYPEVARYMAMLLVNRENFDKITELLSKTEGWGKIAVLELLTYNNLLNGKIDYQIELIEAVYSGNFVLSVETDPIIAHNFDIIEILNKSTEDSELFLNLTNLLNISIEGGVYTSLLNTPEGREKFIKYIEVLEQVEFEHERLIGYIILYRTFKYVPAELMEQILGKEYDYKKLKKDVKNYLDENYKEEIVSEIIQSENEFFLLDYAIDHKKSFVLDIVKKKYSGNLYNYNYLNLVFEIGTKKAKNEVIKRFKEEFDIEERQKEKFSMESDPEWAVHDKYKFDAVYSMIIANFHKFDDEELYNFMEYGLYDFDPQIRHASLIALLTAEDYEMNKEISKQVKRLLAETPHVRAAASEVMKAYGIKLTKSEFGEITEKLGDKIKDDEKEYMVKELVR
ncbi:hypothetical protein [Sebaldella sp. S0638]|uniref:hypothetical protein n=1 Tax=Sebaldella sp. S0638 TaxID=2957809 RepID=UPI0020A115B1|nr:hypothetical protein [Sebaldella sp. S0638]MCP1222795.1 hypothetical protein [Sebaldella sp. S0638]